MAVNLFYLKPYKAKRGEVTTKWEGFANVMNGCTDEHGYLIFPRKMSARSFKNRFDDVMKWVKGFENGVPFRSGQDDEDPANQLLQNIESIYSEYDDYQLSQVAEKEGKEKERQKALAGAHSLNLGALGMYERNKDNLIPVDPDTFAPAPTSARAGRSSVSPTDESFETPIVWHNN